MRDSVCHYDYMIYTALYFIYHLNLFLKIQMRQHTTWLLNFQDVQENLRVSYTKKQQPLCPSNNIIWPAYIITTNTGTLYFDFQGMPMKSHSAWVLREIPITLHILLSQIPSSPYSCTKLMAHLYIHTVKLDWLTNSDKPYLHASFHLQFSQASSRPKQCNHSLTTCNTAYIRLNRSYVLMGPFFSFSPSLSLSLSLDGITIL